MRPLKLVDERHKAACYRYNISISIYGLSLRSIMSVLAILIGYDSIIKL